MTNILLIEPNTVLARTYEAALTGAGYAVRRVAGAQAGINAADTQVPDLIVLELQLPGHSGIEFLHEFCSYPEWQTIPVVINTTIMPSALAGVEQALRRDLGVRAILYKPSVTLKDMLRVVKEQLAGS